MLEDGIAVQLLVVIEEQDRFYFRYSCGESFANPERLPGVACCVLDQPFDAFHPQLAAAISESSPDVVLAVGDLAALLATGHGSGVPVVLYVTGADEVPGRRTLVPRPGLAKAAAKAGFGSIPGEVTDRHAMWSVESAAAAYLIVAPSEAARRAYVASFPSWAGKIHPRPVWPAEWLDREASRFAPSKRPWAERDIDAILVANRWSRPLKNLPLLRRVAARSRGLAIVVVGEGGRECPGVTAVGLVPARAAFMELLGRAKALVCPSTFEASATPLYEAASMGCNLVSSRDCGNFELCADELLSRPDDAADFGEKLALAVRAPLPGRLDTRARAGSYADLVDTLVAVAD